MGMCQVLPDLSPKKIWIPINAPLMRGSNHKLNKIVTIGQTIIWDRIGGLKYFSESKIRGIKIWPTIKIVI